MFGVERTRNEGSGQVTTFSNQSGLKNLECRENRMQ